MNKDSAAEMFGKMLFEQGVVSGSQIFMELLITPRGTHKTKWQKAKDWYEQAPDETQEMLRFLIQQATILSTFQIAYKFDEGLDEKDGQVVNYPVSVNTYADRAAADQGTPKETIQICPTEDHEDIHDILMGYVDELEV